MKVFAVFIQYKPFNPNLSPAPCECESRDSMLCSVSERHVGRPVLVRSLQGHESHAVHRLRRSGSGGNDGRLAHHAQHDRGRHVLRHVHRPRHGPHPVPGLVAPTISGEGKALTEGGWRLLSDLIHAVLYLSVDI